MAKKQIRPKLFTDEKGQLNALIGEDDFFCFFPQRLMINNWF